MDSYEALSDAEVEGVSNCCSGKVYQPDLCASCGEHCESVTE